MTRAPSPAAGRSGRLRRAALVCAMLAAAPLDRAAGEPAQPRYTAWQEIVLLTVVKLRHAAANCGYRVEGGRLDALLGSAELSEASVDAQLFSPSLARQAAADADLYLDGKDAACAEAWGRYGPDGAPGIRDMLTR